MTALQNVATPSPTTPGSARIRAWRRKLRLAGGDLDRNLPWTNHGDPWAIFIAEIMLQQTSVARVRESWARFYVQFPTPQTCAAAPLSDVIIAWAGLGYNRRARNLHRAAQLMCERFHGAVPESVAELAILPGVGDYTARSVATFAFGHTVGIVDTNVGRVLSRCVVNGPLRRSEAQKLADCLVDVEHPAQYDQSMLDLGAQFCRSTPRCTDCPVRTLCAWRRAGGPDPAVGSASVSRPQSTFAGSDREARGRLISHLRTSSLARADALAVLSAEPARAHRLLSQLEKDGLIASTKHHVSLVSTPTGASKARF